MTMDTSPDHSPDHRPSHAEVSDVVGDPAHSGTVLPLAALFPLLDIAGGRCAAVHVDGRVVTGCFDHVHMHSRAHHGDVVVCRAVVVHTGSRSMLIRIDAFREPRVIALHTLSIPVPLLRYAPLPSPPLHHHAAPIQLQHGRVVVSPCD